MRIQVKAHPRSKKEEVLKKGDTLYEVWVKEAPEDGKANEAILRALARHLGVPRLELSLMAGASSKNKWVQCK